MSGLAVEQNEKNASEQSAYNVGVERAARERPRSGPATTTKLAATTPAFRDGEPPLAAAIAAQCCFKPSFSANPSHRSLPFLLQD